MRKDLMRKDFMRRESARSSAKRKERGSPRFVYGLIIFLTLGIGLANELVHRLNLEGSFVWMFSIALLVAGLMVEGNKVMIMFIVCGVVAINLPQATLNYYGIDTDVVLAAVCAIIMLPAIYNMLLE